VLAAPQHGLDHLVQLLCQSDQPVVVTRHEGGEDLGRQIGLLIGQFGQGERQVDEGAMASRRETQGPAVLEYRALRVAVLMTKPAQVERNLRMAGIVTFAFWSSSIASSMSVSGWTASRKHASARAIRRLASAVADSSCWIAAWS